MCGGMPLVTDSQHLFSFGFAWLFFRYSANHFYGIVTCVNKTDVGQALSEWLISPIPRPWCSFELINVSLCPCFACNDSCMIFLILIVCFIQMEFHNIFNKVRKAWTSNFWHYYPVRTWGSLLINSVSSTSHLTRVCNAFFGGEGNGQR